MGDHKGLADQANHKGWHVIHTIEIWANCMVVSNKKLNKNNIDALCPEHLNSALWNKNAFLAFVQFRTYFYYKTLLTIGFLLVRRRKHGFYLTGIKAKISNKWRKLLIKNCHWNPAQGGSRGGALGGPSLPLILGKKKKRIAEGRKAGRASDKKPRPYFVTYRSTPFP